ncbi:N-acetylglutamate synthase [Vibrio maritimus]|uniref:N-acetylglutamate synthase n=1 Tax=Vibrio maritimus TaxID=990268 RepID=A0A090SZH1_9VIBR|nr:N-acetylglutamate synthase [Vibrio maritimus]
MVIMLGGEAFTDKNFTNIVSDIALLHSLGVKLVLVHGAKLKLTNFLNTMIVTVPITKAFESRQKSA